MTLNRAGSVLLVAGAALVGAAIALDGGTRRLANGAGAFLWFTATAMLTVAATRTRPRAWLWGVLAIVVVTVAFLVKPSAVVPAIIGFVPAGFVMASFAPHGKVTWALLAPAWYLPAHIVTAVVVAVVDSLLGNEATLRTEPPPTAAIVPMVMVACAMLGGLVAIRTLGPLAAVDKSPSLRLGRGRRT